MKILILFLDMVRNNLVNENSEIYKILENLKGTWYHNTFSSYPDTGRAIGAFLSGEKAYINGCDNRVKYPRFFLKSKSLFDFYKNNGYKIDIFAHQHHIIPYNFLDNTQFDIPLEKFLSSIKLNSKHLIFMDIPTYHSIIDNYGKKSKSTMWFNVNSS